MPSASCEAVAPIAAPAQLAVYPTDPVQLLQDAGLLPTDRGADVLLPKPADPSQVERTRVMDGATHVGLSQLVIDLLAGNGRMPEEGEAVLDWMRRHEDQWRLPELPRQPRRARPHDRGWANAVRGGTMRPAGRPGRTN